MSETEVVILAPYNTVNSANNILHLPLNFPVQLRGKEIALQSLYLNYSWPNCSSTTYKNNVCQYINSSGVTKTITFPTGFYQVSDINGFIQLQMFNNGDYLIDNNGNVVYFLTLTSNYTYYTVTLTASVIPAILPTGWTNPHSINLSGTTMQFIINNAAFGQLIGWTTGTYPASPSATTYQADGTITPEISPTISVNVNCNLVTNNRFNTQFPTTLYTFSPNTTYASQIQINPYQLLWLPINDGWYNAVTISLTDQSYQPLGNVDTAITATLLIRNRH